MIEATALAVVALVAGTLIGAAIGHDKGWRAGVEWAQDQLFGRKIGR